MNRPAGVDAVGRDGRVVGMATAGATVAGAIILTAALTRATGIEAGRLGQGETVLEITPEADTWYEEDVGTGVPVNPEPQGSGDVLKAGWSDIGIDEHALVRFAVPAVLPDHRLESAELELAIVHAGVGTLRPPVPVSGDMVLSIRAVESGWDEAALTSLTPPDIGSAVQRATVPWGPCAVRVCGTALIDVTALVQAWMNGTIPNHGLAMSASAVNDGPMFWTSFEAASRDSDRPPILRIRQMRPLDATLTPSGPPTAQPTVSTTPLDRWRSWIPIASKAGEPGR